MAQIKEAIQHVHDALDNKSTKGHGKRQHMHYDMADLMQNLDNMFNVKDDDLEALFGDKGLRKATMKKLLDHDVWREISVFFVDEIEAIAKGDNPVAFAAVYDSLETMVKEEYESYLENQLEALRRSNASFQTKRQVEEIYFEHDAWFPSQMNVHYTQLPIGESEFIQRTKQSDPDVLEEWGIIID